MHFFGGQAACVWQSVGMKTKWNWIGKKSDEAGFEWAMWERDGIVKRTNNQNSHNFTRTLYWRRGTFGADGRPVWKRYLSDITEGTQNGE